MTATQLESIVAVETVLSNATCFSLTPDERNQPIGAQTGEWITTTIATLEDELKGLDPKDDVARNEIISDLGLLTTEAQRRRLMMPTAAIDDTPATEGDEADTPQVDAEPEPEPEPVVDERPIGKVLGARTLSGLSARMKKEPLSKQANEWLLTATARVSDELMGLRAGGTKTRPEPEIVADLRVLMDALEARGALDQLPAAVLYFVGGVFAAGVFAPETDEPIDPESAKEVMASAFPDGAVDASGEYLADANPVITEREASTSSVSMDDEFAAFTLEELPTTLRARSLADQSNEWLLETIERLVAVIPGCSPTPRRELELDLLKLFAAAELRGIGGQISEVATFAAAGMFEKIDASEDVDDTPVAERDPSSAGEPHVLETSTSIEVDPSRIYDVPLDDIDPDPAQARDEGADDSIGDTLKPEDVLPAIELRVHPNPAAGKPYMVVDGERRWRGSRKANRTTIRAWVNPNPGDDGDRLLRQVALNDGQRLKPMEEARTWKRVMAAKGWNIQQLATHLKRSKSTVSDRLAMLDTPPAFAAFFMDGTLSAAAAPIVRRFAGITEEAAQQVVQYATNHPDWEDAIKAGKTVPLKTVEEAFMEAAGDELPQLWPSDPETKLYTGPVMVIEKRRYALDIKAYDKATEESRAQQHAAHEANSAPSTKGDAQAVKVRAEERARKERDRADREKVAAKKQSAEQLRAAQFAAVSAKLPTTLDGRFVLFVLRVLVDVVGWNLTDKALAAMGIAVPAGKTLRGRDYPALVMKHAEKLDAKACVRLLLQLAIYDEEAPYAKSDDRIAAAAQLLKLDLKKITAPDPAPAKPVGGVLSTATKKKLAAVKKPAAKKSTKAAKPSKSAKRKARQ